MVDYARQTRARRSTRRRSGERGDEPATLPGIPDPSLALRGDRAAVEALQKTAGNAATTGLLEGVHLTVQREGDNLDAALAGIEDDAGGISAILAEANASDARGLFREAMARYRRHAYVEAGQLFEEAAALAPQASPEILFNAARSYEMAARGRSSRRGSGRSGGAAQRDGADAEAVARDEAASGVAAYSSGRWSAAIAAFRRAMAAVPAPEFEWNIAMAFFRAGQHADALDHFRAFAALSGSSAARPWIRRCERAAARGGEVSERDLAVLGESDVESMNAIVEEAAREDARADFEAGTDLFRHGAFGTAAERFASASAAVPDSPELVFDIAVASQRAGDYPAAIAAYRRFLGIGG